MKKKRYKKLTAILAAVLLLCSGIPVMAAEVNNGTTYPVSTNAIANWIVPSLIKTYTPNIYIPYIGQR